MVPNWYQIGLRCGLCRGLGISLEIRVVHGEKYIVIRVVKVAENGHKRTKPKAGLIYASSITQTSVEADPFHAPLAATNPNPTIVILMSFVVVRSVYTTIRTPSMKVSHA